MIDVKLISIRFGRFVSFPPISIELWIDIFETVHLFAARRRLCSTSLEDVMWRHTHTGMHSMSDELKRNYRVRFLWCARRSTGMSQAQEQRPICSNNNSFNGNDELRFRIYCCKTLILRFWCLVPDAWCTPFRNETK